MKLDEEYQCEKCGDYVFVMDEEQHKASCEVPALVYCRELGYCIDMDAVEEMGCEECPWYREC